MPRPWLSSASAVVCARMMASKPATCQLMKSPKPSRALRCASHCAGAVAVGAEGQHQRRLQHHRLVEVQFAQALLARRVDGLDDRHHVQVAAGRRPHR
jgi:hypothetical protein